MRLPSLTALRAFAVAARHPTLEAAAGELNVTHGAVSRQIQALEADLGVVLFHRSGRTRALSAQGQVLAQRLHGVFAALSDAVEAARVSPEPRPLVVSCEPTLCMKLLIRALGSLRAETGLDVVVRAAGGPISFGVGGIDLAIRRDDFPIAAGLHQRVLAEEATGPVQVFGVTSPRLVSATRPEAWSRWERERGLEPAPGPTLTFEHHYLALEAAQAGHGVAMASVFMVASDIAAGLLQAPQGFTPDGSRYLCLSPVDFASDPRRALFADWITERMAAVARGGADRRAADGSPPP